MEARGWRRMAPTGVELLALKRQKAVIAHQGHINHTFALGNSQWGMLRTLLILTLFCQKVCSKKTQKKVDQSLCSVLQTPFNWESSVHLNMQVCYLGNTYKLHTERRGILNKIQLRWTCGHQPAARGLDSHDLWGNIAMESDAMDESVIAF